MIIGLTGKMGAGKSAVAELMLANHGYNYGFLYKFAQPMYDIHNYACEVIGQPLVPKDRKLLQFLGTEWGRGKDENLWVNLWYEKVAKRNYEFEGELLIIADDVRFDNEAQAIKKLGGKVIYVDTDEAIRGQRINLTNTSHPSENGVSHGLIDATIYNNKSLYDLELNVKYLIDLWES